MWLRSGTTRGALAVASIALVLVCALAASAASAAPAGRPASRTTSTPTAAQAAAAAAAQRASPPPSTAKNAATGPKPTAATPRPSRSSPNGGGVGTPPARQTQEAAPRAAPPALSNTKPREPSQRSTPSPPRKGAGAGGGAAGGAAGAAEAAAAATMPTGGAAAAKVQTQKGAPPPPPPPLDSGAPGPQFVPDSIRNARDPPAQAGGQGPGKGRGKGGNKGNPRGWKNSDTPAGKQLKELREEFSRRKDTMTQTERLEWRKRFNELRHRAQGKPQPSNRGGDAGAPFFDSLTKRAGAAIDRGVDMLSEAATDVANAVMGKDGNEKENLHDPRGLAAAAARHTTAFSPSHLLKFVLPPLTEECFYENVEESSTYVRGDFFVTSTDDRAAGINVALARPDGVELRSFVRRLEGEFQVEADDTGLYELCLENPARTEATVVLAWLLGADEDNVLLRQMEAAGSGSGDDDAGIASPLVVLIASLHEKIDAAQAEITYHRERLDRNHQTAENTQSRVAMFTWLEVLAFWGALYLQVVVVKSMLSRRKRGGYV